MDDPGQIRGQLRAWLHERVMEPVSLDSLGDGSDLLADGIVDSFLMLELLQWIEDEHGVFIDFADETLGLTRFGALADHVAVHRPAPEAAA
jgi:hypothetical protein